MPNTVRFLRRALLGLTLASPALGVEAPGPDIGVAIFGDSLATGAATHPALTFDTSDLWGVFSGKIDLRTDKAAPQRLWPSRREFFGGADWVYRNMLQGLSRHYLDTEEYSWGYQLAEALGVPAGRVAIAAENGARAQDLTRQADRLIDLTSGQLPPRVFALYTGNDLCGPAAAFTTTSEDYKDGLRRGIKRLTSSASPAVGGTDIYVPGFLGILQLVDGDEILGKKVKAFGKETTCRELRRAAFRPTDPAYDPGLPADAWGFAMVMPPNPAAYCPTLFGEAGVNGVDEAQRREEIATLANRIRAYREAQRALVEELTAGKTDGFRFHYVAATETVVFKADDIAGDCFHLSRAGQAKVAQAVGQGLAIKSP